MRLFIDTSDTKRIVLGFNGEKITAKTKQEKVQMLLPLIARELEKRGKKKEDITEIEFMEGPGSFTGLRVGAAVANALSWALNIAVNKHPAAEKPVVPKYE